MLTEFAHRLVLMLCGHLRDVFEVELLTSTCFASHPPRLRPSYHLCSQYTAVWYIV